MGSGRTKFTWRAVLAGATLCLGGAVLAQGTNYSNVVVNTRNYTGGAGGSIPDNNTTGITTSITVPDSETVIGLSSVTISGLTHTWAGDLIATVSHNSTSVDLFSRPGGTNEDTDFGGNYTFINGGANLVTTLGGLGATAAAPTGNYAPLGNFGSFAGLNSNGAWNLNLSDRANLDTGSFTGWNFSVQTGNVTTIPDAPITGSPTTSISSLIITDSYLISAVNSVTIRGLNHTAVGDLIVSLVHVPSNTVVDLFSQVGKTTTDPFDVGDDSNLNGDYVFALGGSSFANAAAGGNSAFDIPTNVTYAASTSTVPGQALTTTMASFNGLNVNGEWQLRVTDTASGDIGSFLGFVLNVSSSVVPEPGSLALLALCGLPMGLLLRRNSPLNSKEGKNL